MIETVEIHYRNYVGTVRKCRTFSGHHHAPSRLAVVNLINKCEGVGSIQKIKNGDRPRTGRWLENVAVVCR